MKRLDLTSTIVAAIAGAVALMLVQQYGAPDKRLETTDALKYGAMAGIVVQTVVRLTGVS